MGKCAKGGSFQVSSQLQNFTNFSSFRMYIMLLNLVHKLKCERNLIFYPRNPASTFRNGDFLGTFLKACT